MDAASLKSLAAALIKAGAPALGGVLAGPLGAAGGKLAGEVIGAHADALGVEPTAEAVATRIETDPVAAAPAVAGVDAETVARLALARVEAAADLVRAETARETWFSWAWRPAMSWLLIALWTWALLVLPTLKATALPGLQPIPIENLTSFTGIWLAIYGGGHTLKSIFAR